MKGQDRISGTSTNLPLREIQRQFKKTSFNNTLQSKKSKEGQTLDCFPAL